MARSRTLAGAWRIVQTEVWDREFLDLMGPARIAIDAQGRGEFSFGCVNGAFSAKDAGGCFEASWTGNDEMDETSGQIFIQREPDGSLTGEISFHNGDESEFRAVQWTSSTAC